MSAQRNRLHVGLLCVREGHPCCQQQGETPLQGKEHDDAVWRSGKAEGKCEISCSDHKQRPAATPSEANSPEEEWVDRVLQEVVCKTAASKAAAAQR